MKLKIKIILIAFAGMSLGMKAQNKIGPTGNVGIGTIDPSSKLEIKTFLPSPSTYEIQKWTNTHHNGYNLSLKTIWNTSGINHAFIQKFNGKDYNSLSFFGGNIGIGTTSPNEKLEINGNTKFSNLYLPSGNIEEKGNKIYQKFTDNNGSAEANIEFYRNKSSRGGGVRSSSEIRFSTTSSSYSADNLGLSTKMIVKGNGNVGIGTTSPNSKLEIKTSTPSPSTYEIQKWTNTHHNGYNLSLKTIWSTSGINHAFIQKFNGKDYNSLSFFGGNIGIGTTNPDSKLSVNGKIHTKEVKVDLVGWSDFVFYDDYKLPTLTEVETHIKEKGHLKDIPSAKEVAKNGILLGEMDSKLLQKIEELTLYTIAQEKDLQSQKEEIDNLKKKNETLKSLNFKLLEIQKRLDKLEEAK